jgi:hypothetical protein
MLPWWGAERNHGSAGVYIWPVLGSSSAGRARGMLQSATIPTHGGVKLPGPEFVQSIRGSKTDAVLRPIGAVPGTVPGRGRQTPCRPAVRPDDLQLVGVHLPALAHVEHDPTQQLVALRVEAPRDQCERHPAGPGPARRTRRQLVEVRDGGERGQRLHEQDRRGVEQGGPSQMPLPKPTAIRTWPAIAVIGAAVATTLKITSISPTAFGRGRWTALVLGFWVTGPRSSRMCLTSAKPKRGGSVGVIRGSHERFQRPACEQSKTIEKRCQR